MAYAEPGLLPELIRQIALLVTNRLGSSAASMFLAMSNSICRPLANAARIRAEESFLDAMLADISHWLASTSADKGTCHAVAGISAESLRAMPDSARGSRLEQLSEARRVHDWRVYCETEDAKMYHSQWETTKYDFALSNAAEHLAIVLAIDTVMAAICYLGSCNRPVFTHFVIDTATCTISEAGLSVEPNAGRLVATLLDHYCSTFRSESAIDSALGVLRKYTQCRYIAEVATEHVIEAPPDQLDAATTVAIPQLAVAHCRSSWSERESVIVSPVSTGCFGRGKGLD